MWSDLERFFPGNLCAHDAAFIRCHAASLLIERGWKPGHDGESQDDGGPLSLNRALWEGENALMRTVTAAGIEIDCDGYCTDGASRRAFEESLNQIFTLDQLDAEGVWPLRMLHAWEQEECRTAQDILLALLGAGFAHRFTDCAEDAHCGICMTAAA